MSAFLLHTLFGGSNADIRLFLQYLANGANDWACFFVGPC